MKKLIINADDFALTDGVCRGIVEAINHGLVSSTSAMVCMPGAAERIALWAPQIEGKIGLHLQLTGDCEPCLSPDEIPSLVTETGRFPRRPEDVRAEADQVVKEWRAQVARLRELSVEPSHLDSHHHIHQRSAYYAIYADIAGELARPVRNQKRCMANILDARGVAHPTTCITGWFGANTDLAGLITCLEAAYNKVGADQLVELMCHPGYADDELRAISSYTTPREAELGVLTAPETAQALTNLNIEVVGWSGLRPAAA